MAKLSAVELLKKKKQAISDKSAGRKNTVSFPHGESKWRILPGWRKDGDETFFHEFGQSWIKSQDKEIMAVIGDAAMTFGEDDPVRNLIQTAIGASRTDAQREHFKEMLAKPRILLNVQALDNKDLSEDEAHILEVSEFQFEQIIDQAEMARIIDIFLDAEKGFDLIVKKTGKGKNGTKYAFSFERDAREVPTSVLDTINDLDAFVRSKFNDADRSKAINAIKSLSTGAEVLGIEDKNVDRGGSSSRNALDDNSDQDAGIEEAEYSAVDEAKENNIPDTNVNKREVNDAELAELFGDD